MQRLTIGDEVVVIRGDHKGKRGKVTRVLRERGAVVIQGVNIVKRHLRATPQRGGGILEVEAPIDASKVMLIDAETGKRTRARYELRDGKKVRVAKSGGVITAQKA